MIFGCVFLGSGIVIFILQFALAFTDVTGDIDLLSVSLGCISVGLGFIALSVAAKSDRRHTELMNKLRKEVARIPADVGDILTLSGRVFEVKTPRMRAQDALEKSKEEAQRKEEAQSKEKAKKRLDEDTKNVGFVRGKIYKKEAGKWVISWGGEFPL